MFVYIFGLFNLLVCVTTLFGHSGLFVLFFVGLVQFGCFVCFVCVCVFGWLLAWVVGILGRWVVCFNFHQQRALLGSSAQISCGAAPGQVPEGAVQKVPFRRSSQESSSAVPQSGSGSFRCSSQGQASSGRFRGGSKKVRFRIPAGFPS